MIVIADQMKTQIKKYFSFTRCAETETKRFFLHLSERCIFFPATNEIQRWCIYYCTQIQKYKNTIVKWWAYAGIDTSGCHAAAAAKNMKLYDWIVFYWRKFFRKWNNRWQSEKNLYKCVSWCEQRVIAVGKSVIMKSHCRRSTNFSTNVQRSVGRRLTRPNWPDCYS